MGIKAATEQGIQRGMLAVLNLHGWGVKVPAGGARRGDHYVRLAPAGTPDLIGGLPHPDHGGRMILVAVEVKKPGGRLRPAQAAQLDAIRRRGGLALVCRDVAELVAALRAEGFAV